MTRDEILKMPAGQDMDLLISDKVLHLSVEQWNKLFLANKSGFSTDWGAAGLVVEKLRQEYHFTLRDYTTADLSAHWVAEFYTNRVTFLSAPVSFLARAYQPPLAICRAALLASLDTQPRQD